MPAPSLSGLIRVFALVLVLGPGAAGLRGQIIAVLGNNMAITAGDTSPSLADHTEFGSVAAAAGVIDRTFTITNTGSATLQIALQRIGGNFLDFTIPFPPEFFIVGGGHTTFTVRFNPSGPGTRSTTIRITSNAINTQVFDFAIKGFGLFPESDINLQGNGVDIPDGDPLPSVAKHTDFESIDIEAGSITRTFTIQNLGDLVLNLSALQFLGGNTSAFTFTRAPAIVVQPATETSFDVTFDPVTTGLHTTTIRIINTDLNEGIYDFVIKGEGTTNAPELTLLGNGMTISPGDVTPAAADHTKFEGIGVHEGSSARTFTIENTGSDDLVVASIVTAGGQAAEFSISSVPAGPIPPGGEVTFDVLFDPAAYGASSTTLRLTSNDPRNPVYEVGLFGAGGKFELLRVVRDGTDAIVIFHSNPDTSVSTYIYNITHSTDLRSWLGIKSFSIPGGTLEQHRIRNGWVGPTGYWRIQEVTIE